MGKEKPGTIVYHPSHCSACGICEVVCSLRHEGTAGPALARVNILRDPFAVEHRHILCLQCENPACYFACPARDKVLCVDRAAGVTYINEDLCNGCGLCIEACPYEPPRIKSNVRKNVAFKCDLCRGREEGPLCVESCPFQALTLTNEG